MYFKDIPFKSLCPPDVLNQAKTWLVENKKKFSATANFAVFNEKGQYDDYRLASCHAKISHSNLANRVCVATEVGWNRNAFDKSLSSNVIEGFLRYFLYESYASRFILNSDDFSFCRDYGVVVSADIPTPFMQNILIMSRHFYECHPRSFVLFDNLVSKGCNPDLAYHLSFNNCLSSVNDTELDQAFRTYYGHRTQAMPSFQQIELILDKKMHHDFTSWFDPSNHYRVYNPYSGGISLYGRGCTSFASRMFLNDLFRDEKFKDVLFASRNKGLTKEGYKPPNPFIKRSTPQIPPDNFSLEEYRDVVIPYLLEKYRGR